MTFFHSRSAFILILAFSFGVSTVALAKEKQKEPEGQSVDSGSFGVFIGTRRVGTETFSVYKTANGSAIQSEFKTEGAAEQAVQNSEMQLTASGDIRRYDWKELSPGKAQLSVVPNDQVLTQKWSTNPQDKPQEQPYILPASTSILDDYFFVHREVLAWKFLGLACKQEKGVVQCPLKQRVQFGSMNPRQHSSAPVSLEYLGREKTAIRGTDHELNKVELKSDAGIWNLWLDDQFKVLRISIPSENTEVVRD